MAPPVTVIGTAPNPVIVGSASPLAPSPAFKRRVLRFAILAAVPVRPETLEVTAMSTEVNISRAVKLASTAVVTSAVATVPSTFNT